MSGKEHEKLDFPTDPSNGSFPDVSDIAEASELPPPIAPEDIPDPLSDSSFYQHADARAGSAAKSSAIPGEYVKEVSHSSSSGSESGSGISKPSKGKKKWYQRPVVIVAVALGLLAAGILTWVIASKDKKEKDDEGLDPLTSSTRVVIIQGVGVVEEGDYQFSGPFMEPTENTDIQDPVEFMKQKIIEDFVVWSQTYLINSEFLDGECSGYFGILNSSGSMFFVAKIRLLDMNEDEPVTREFYYVERVEIATDGSITSIEAANTDLIIGLWDVKGGFETLEDVFGYVVLKGRDVRAYGFGDDLYGGYYPIKTTEQVSREQYNQINTAARLFLSDRIKDEIPEDLELIDRNLYESLLVTYTDSDGQFRSFVAVLFVTLVRDKNDPEKIKYEYYQYVGLEDLYIGRDIESGNILYDSDPEVDICGYALPGFESEWATTNYLFDKYPDAQIQVIDFRFPGNAGEYKTRHSEE